jgi:hypothetical protein
VENSLIVAGVVSAVTLTNYGLTLEEIKIIKTLSHLFWQIVSVNAIYKSQ